jgi:hypothetical protein
METQWVESYASRSQEVKTGRRMLVDGWSDDIQHQAMGRLHLAPGTWYLVPSNRSFIFINMPGCTFILPFPLTN